MNFPVFAGPSAGFESNQVSTSDVLNILDPVVATGPQGCGCCAMIEDLQLPGVNDGESYTGLGTTDVQLSDVEDDDLLDAGDVIQTTQDESDVLSDSSDTPPLLPEDGDRDDGPPTELWSLQQIADYVRVGYWDAKGASHRMMDLSDGIVTVNISQLDYDGQQSAIRALDTWAEVTGIDFQYLYDGSTWETSAANIFFDDEEAGRAFSGVRDWGSYNSDAARFHVDKNFINIDKNWTDNEAYDPNNYTTETYIHEIGHALGLGHTGAYNASEGDPTYAEDALFLNDTVQYSIMSYWTQYNFPTSSGVSNGNILTPQMADILAIYDIYGDDVSAATGNSWYGYNGDGTILNDIILYHLDDDAHFTLTDTGGIDSFDLYTANGEQWLDLTPGSFSSINNEVDNMAIALNTIIENAYGSDNVDHITGNDAANQIYGRGGNDTLIGGGGDDTLNGGYGDDTLWGYWGHDYLDGSYGDDTLYGNDGNDTFTDAEGTNTFYGNVGDDYYYMGWDSGFNNYVVEYGFEGIDTVFVYDATGTAGQFFVDLRTDFNGASIENIELSGVQYDDIVAIGTDDYGNYMLANVAGSELQGLGGDDTLEGRSGNDRLFGNADNDTLWGMGGDDIMVGGTGSDILDGGTGSDSMYGEEGNDTYYVDDYGDLVMEFGEDSHDTIYASLSWDMNRTGDESANVEYLYLTGTADIHGWGNARANYMYGNSGANYLYGYGANDFLYGEGGDDNLLGGDGYDYLNGGEGADTLTGEAGADTMAGGNGNDTYYVDAEDVGLLYEYADSGYDWVYSAVSWDLVYRGDAYEEFEALALTGVDNITGHGNALDNQINGNTGSNVLYGRDGNDTLRGDAGDDALIGGLGDDILAGGLGSDTLVGDEGNDIMSGNEGDDYYIVEDAGDDLYEFAGNGHDTIGAYISWDMIQRGDEYEEFEDLDLYGSALNGWGNALNNRISGNELANILDGREGNDTLYGRDGNDILTGGLGDDIIDGGDGRDYAVFGGSAAATVDLNETGAQDTGHGIDTLTGIESISSGSGDDVLVGNDNDNDLISGAGNDVLDGGLGDDFLSGGDGEDTALFLGGQDMTVDLNIVGAQSTGQGNDSLVSIENVTSGTGSDILIGDEGGNRLAGNGGDDQLFGGGGRDTLAGGQGNDTLDGGDGVDRLIGSGGDDTMTGGNDDDILGGGGGADQMDGGDGDDRLNGNGGADVLLGGNGIDVLDGGAGDDMVAGGADDDIVKGANGNDTVDGGSGNDTIEGGRGGDTLIGRLGEDTLLGGIGNDTMDGGNDDDTLDGGNNNDTMDGGRGNDILLGGAGIDTLDGGIGDDTMDGGLGNDTLLDQAGDDIMIGGGGSDIFVFGNNGGNNQILDFSASNNREDIDLSAVTSITDFVDLQANHMVTSGDDVVIDDGNGTVITLVDVNIAGLGSVDFIF